MSLRNLLVAMILLAIAGWWFSPHSPRVPAPPKHADATAHAGCPLPPLVARGQGAVAERGARIDGAVPARGRGPATLAGFSVDARVLSREDYSLGREAGVFAHRPRPRLGSHGDEAVLDRLDISQSSRWYHCRWRGDPPIPPQEIIQSSANMHMIPSDRTVASFRTR